MFIRPLINVLTYGKISIPQQKIKTVQFLLITLQIMMFNLFNLKLYKEIDIKFEFEIFLKKFLKSKSLRKKKKICNLVDSRKKPKLIKQEFINIRIED